MSHNRNRFIGKLNKVGPFVKDSLIANSTNRQNAPIYKIQPYIAITSLPINDIMQILRCLDPQPSKFFFSIKLKFWQEMQH